jgi:hypothetical protein
MKDFRTYSVYPSNLDMLSAFKRLKDYLAENKFEESEAIYLKLFISPYRNINAVNFKEFITLLEKYPSALPLDVHIWWKKGKARQFFSSITISRSEISVSVDSYDLMLVSALHDKIKECFSASNPHQEQMERLSKYGLKKSIFLAHRFDDYGDRTGTILNTFFYRLGFDVKEGSGYEAKGIPDKVAAKIKSQDIFVCLVTPGDTSWILSEAGYAKGLNKYLIVVCEDGVSFNKGIIGGDYEHIPFPPDNIEKSFLELINALPI